MSFSSQGFAPELVKALTECGYEKLTPIQQKAIPMARKGHDIFATAQTGTGKTAAFSLPVIQHLLNSGKKASRGTARGLILAPTRELAAQIAQNIKDYVKYTELSVSAVYGGNKMSSQVRQLELGVDILVATPGRLEEHLEAGNVSIANLEFLVFDEADRILDMGFINAVRKIMLDVETSPQIMMFSATTSTQLNQLSVDILRKPKRISVERENSTAATVGHVVYPVDQERKTELLSELIGRKNWRQVLVFVNYKETANEVVKELKLDGIKAVLCHGDKAQSARRRALDDFKEGKARVMVATDVAARGLDIEDLPHVINYDMPFLAEDYVHRIGRTGRAGKQGHAVSFVNREEELTVVQVEKLIQQRIRRVEQPGYEPKKRDAYIEKLNTKAAYKNRQGRKNNANDAPQDQASAERRLAMMKRIKNRRK
ncbi:ATP-dependent RNA helicase RhlE [Vibrio chagasii]|uniref:DEAD/DEAH box helicase n=1 Tax=Vibrio chagasii TaxID=170679 RepID=A0A2S7VNV8_9VIBR|nr:MULTISPECIES: DEAD/DEAH box helicase [Vibrio]EDK28964.1 DNA and RNA helicase [Vibrionales bacterium SWAT-3]EGU42274.1 Superfamily II DNA and RNA helicase [Vibrio splendidus ATCC 33789]KAB0477639.1 DEAD/DEAH box helicase [Vibrio chagasii]KZX57558.1 RNA helicase [Vibrio sp. HI00D65]MBJ2145209.1 DEAD/DEAH box helicase [Vibrio sp. IB15]|eukprot:TRINITY_DN9141_c0_g2_i2.p2 TRINITY_DN9141_c0_g2~~TRINITY_DN9141_c0_g2_i2.p2  ORF type:complete len:429 (-),score=49.52 TRINITY_DN9141_c0_g2_i2:2593-3879(-)